MLCVNVFILCRSLRKALDYTKQSLRISIDLGQHEKSAERWIQAGKLYHLLREDELVEIYLHVSDTKGEICTQFSIV